MKKISLTLLLSSLFFFSRSQQMESFIGGSISKGFIENKGQIRDQSGKPNTNVKYVYNNGVFNLELRKNGFSYELFTVIPDQDPDEAGFSHSKDMDDNSENLKRLAASHRVDVDFIGANAKSVAIPSDENNLHYNFYFAPVSKSRIENVKSFQKITYQNIYPGIDVVFSAPDEQGESPLKYEFMIHPGANANSIRMKYKGTENLSLDERGMLTLDCINGFIKEGAPYCFLSGTENTVKSSNVIDKNTVTFNVASYDKTEMLVIDPSIIWGTYYGGESTEDVAELALDSKNKPTIAGNTLSTANIATVGAYQTTFGGGFFDFFVAKFNASAKIEWATYLGGSGRDVGFGVAVDHDDNIYFNGKTTSDGLATPGAYQTVRGGMDDALIAKFNTNGGGLIWCTYFGGSADDQYRAFTFDDSDNMYVCGYTESSSGIATPGAFQAVYGGGGDGVITKWSTDGAIIWSTYYGASGQDRYHAMVVDPFGDLYIAGTTSSTDSVTTQGAYQTTYGGGGEDLWLCKFDLDDHLIWSTFYGGELDDRARGVEADSTGGVYVAGFTNSTTGISTPGAVQLNWSPGYDTQTGEPLDDDMLFKITSDGTTRLWGTYYGGGAKEELWGMNIDQRQKCIYIVGSSLSDQNIAYGNAWQSVKGNGSDAVFARWAFDGSITWGSYFGKDEGEQFEDVEVDKSDNIYLVGKTEGNQMPATYGVYQTHSNGGAYDGIVYKFYAGIACRDENEPNNSFAGAKVIYARTLNDSLVYGYDGNLRSSTDKDYFKIKVTSGYKNLFVELTGLSHNYDLKMYNANQVLKAQSNHTGINPDTIIANQLPPGDYYIQVLAGSPAVYDTMACYHINLIKSSTKFTTNDNQNKLFESNTAELKIYPNPASSEISLELNSELNESAQLRIFDLAGHLLKTQDLSLTEGFQQIELPISQLTAGTYNVGIYSAHKTWVNLIVKE